MSSLHFIRFQKFSSGRDIKKYILYRNYCSFSADYGFLFFDTRSDDGQHRSHFIFGATRFHFNMRYGCYRRQGLTSESHRVQRKKIVGISDFRCGMSFKSHASVSYRHSIAIVYHLYECSTRIFNNNLDMGRARIYRIFDQLLDYRCRPLDNLSGSDLICDRVRQQMYDVGHIWLKKLVFYRMENLCGLIIGNRIEANYVKIQKKKIAKRITRIKINNPLFDKNERDPDSSFSTRRFKCFV
ncbi:MAG: hypothetical protein BWZ06_01285 [Bacteroidetes bacterium ADurb.BinA261]|nr:MAG: hypothetical protein BWZ06_01285 [Bacteroidetes bacterium ADurb.BinA261]